MPFHDFVWIRLIGSESVEVVESRLRVPPCIPDRAPTLPDRNKYLLVVRNGSNERFVLQMLTTEPCVSIVGAATPLRFRDVVVKGDPDFLLCKLCCYSIKDLAGG
jgi:hypothetical protein